MVQKPVYYLLPKLGALVKMQEDCLVINNVPTKILTWGKNVHDNFLENEQLIVVIPGNPGLTGFYTEFLQELHNVTRIPIWVLSHAGHEIVESERMPNRKGNEHLYSLDGQVRHKEIFIENHVLPKGINFYLIGHSIGSYIILELLKNVVIKPRVLHNYLLFPTIEYMAESPNGVLITKVLSPLKFLLLPLVYLIYILPDFVKIFLIGIYAKLSNIPEHFSSVILSFLHPYVIQNFVQMGLDEMRKVRKPNGDVLRENASTIKLYYGTTDRWVPVGYYERMKINFPEVDAKLCDKKYEHAFVLRHSVPMAHLVGEWIKSRQKV